MAFYGFLKLWLRDYTCRRCKASIIISALNSGHVQRPIMKTLHIYGVLLQCIAITCIKIRVLSHFERRK